MCIRDRSGSDVAPPTPRSAPTKQRVGHSSHTARAAAQAPARGETPRPAVRAEAVKPRKPGLSQKEQRRLDEIERALAEAAERIAGLDALLADPAAFLRPESPGHAALKAREGLLAELDDLELEWLDLEEKRAAP